MNSRFFCLLYSIRLTQSRSFALIAIYSLALIGFLQEVKTFAQVKSQSPNYGRVFRVHRDSRRLIESTLWNVPGARFFVDLYDCNDLKFALTQMSNSRASITIALGNKTANLELSPWIESLNNIPNLEALLLDSVDYTPADLESLKTKNPQLQVFLCYQTAVECIQNSVKQILNNSEQQTFLNFNEPWFPEDYRFLGERFKNYHYMSFQVVPVKIGIPSEAYRYFRHIHGRCFSITLHGSEFQRESLSFFAKCQPEMLTIENVRLENIDLELIDMSEVRELWIIGSPRISAINLKNCPRLKCLWLENSGFSKSFIVSLSECETLESLEFDGADFTEKELVEICENLQQLSQLRIRYDSEALIDRSLETRLKSHAPKTEIEFVLKNM